MWKLASNRGWESLTCTVLAQQAGGSDLGVLVDIALTGEFWDQSVPLADSALTEDFQFRLPQVLLSIARLKELEEALRQYVGLPFDELQAEPFRFECQLGLADHQIGLLFGTSSELVTSSEKSVVNVTLSRGSTMKCETRFETDQSCIREFANALGSYLRVARANRAKSAGGE